MIKTNLVGRNIRKIALILIVLIVGFSFASLFFIQNITKHDIETRMFEQQKGRQMEYTKIISTHMSSDLERVIAMMNGLGNSIYVQQREYSSLELNELMQEEFVKYDNIINRLFILDNNDVMTVGLAQEREPLIGSDLSFRDWVKQTRESNATVFSDGFERQGLYRIFISYPVFDRLSGEYIATIGASVLADPFFSHYKNIENFEEGFLVSYNKNGDLLYNGLNKSLVGLNFFGPEVQDTVNHNRVVNNLTKSLISFAQPSYAVYNYGAGERINTQQPVLVNGEPQYFLQVITPTTQIYSQIQDALYLEEVKIYLLLAGTLAAIVVLVFILVEWNHILQGEVKRRTTELHESETKARELENSYDAMKNYLQEVMKEIKRKQTG
ncbi:MAG: cache domain-containing protein [Nitrososphaeraceae archaeon]